MKIFILTVSLFVCLTLGVSKVWALPDCPPGGYFDNCYGTLTYADGNKYVGEWQNNNMHGYGTYTWADGDKYVGEWQNNKRHGQGAQTYADGSKYVGKFVAGEKHGYGIYTWTDGDRKAGVWKKGEFQYSAKAPVKAVPKGNVSNGIQLAKENFKWQSLVTRKQIQWVLREQSYYGKSIDGAWGPSTSQAIISYSNSNGISLSNSNAIFSSILSEMAVPTSFTSKKRVVKKRKKEGSSLLKKLAIGLTGAVVCSQSAGACDGFVGQVTGQEIAPIDYGSSSTNTTSSSSNSCTTDSICGNNSVCVKRTGSGYGVCMRLTNKYGVRQSSTSGSQAKSCSRTSDCSFGFKCDRTYNVCVKY